MLLDCALGARCAAARRARPAMRPGRLAHAAHAAYLGCKGRPYLRHVDGVGNAQAQVGCGLVQCDRHHVHGGWYGHQALQHGSSPASGIPCMSRLSAWDGAVVSSMHRRCARRMRSKPAAAEDIRPQQALMLHELHFGARLLASASAWPLDRCT